MNEAGIIPIKPSPTGAVEVEATEVRVPQSILSELSALTGVLDRVTIDMQAASDAFRTVQHAEEQRIKERTFEHVSRVRRRITTRAQASAASNDENARAVERVAQAFRRLETVIADLATQAGDTRLRDDKPFRRTFMQATLSAPVIFHQWIWDQLSDAAEPFERTIDLRAAADATESGLDL
jgi:hypothetical protein